MEAMSIKHYWAELVAVCGGIIVIGKIVMMGRNFVTRKELHEHCAAQMQNIELKIENAVIRATMEGIKRYYRENGKSDRGG